MKFYVTVHVFRKRQCVNPENNVICQALNRIERDLEAIERIEKGVFFSILIEAPNPEEAKRIADMACQKLLVNHVMEDFEIINSKEAVEFKKAA